MAIAIVTGSSALSASIVASSLVARSNAVLSTAAVVWLSPGVMSPQSRSVRAAIGCWILAWNLPPGVGQAAPAGGGGDVAMAADERALGNDLAGRRKLALVIAELQRPGGGRKG
jgi:hypothetical protein